jgi:type II secretory pathway pseudopilin PulG
MKKAFTIIELIVVITIIIILLSISTLVASKVIRRERVESETNKLVSLLKEAQKYSMINKCFQNCTQKQQYGVRIAKGNNMEEFIISLVRKIQVKTDENTLNEKELKEKEFYINKINIYRIPPRNNSQPIPLDNESIYFNDSGTTENTMRLRISDNLNEFKRDIVISQLGHINIEKSK